MLKSAFIKVKSLTKKISQSPYFRPTLAVLGAIVGIIGLSQLLRFWVSTPNLATNNAFLLPVGFLLVYYFCHFQLPSRGEGIFSAIIAAVLACIAIIGGQLETTSNIAWRPGTIWAILCVMVLLWPIILTLVRALSKFHQGKFSPSRRHFWIALACVAFTTLWIWLVFYPGIYTYDMASQNELISTGQITSHWSLLYGYLFAGFLDFGKAVFGNYEAGMAIAMFIQASFICYVETRLIIFATKLTKSRVVYVLSIAFFSLIPFFGTMAVSSAQDTLFAGLLALLIIELSRCVINPDLAAKKLPLLKIVLLGLLLCVTRNNGIYCLLVLLIFTLFCYRRPRKTLVAAISISIALALVYSGPVLSLLHVEKPTTLQEILGVPSQQLARAYYLKPSSFSADQAKLLGEFYKLDDGFNTYVDAPMIADFVKWSLDVDAASARLGEYVKLWASVGFKTPDNYIEAFLLNSLGYWYPNKLYPDSRMMDGYMNYPGFASTLAFEDVSQHANMKPVRQQVFYPDDYKELDEFVFGGDWQTKPLTATLCSIGTYTLLLMFAITYLIWRRRFDLLVPCSAIVGLFLTLLLSPVAIFRYAYPIVLLAPLLLAFILCAADKSNTYKAQIAAGASLPRRLKSRLQSKATKQ